MRSHYPELVSFDFQHAYYQSVRSAFVFFPQKHTRRLLRRFGLLFRSTADGFTILYPAVKEKDNDGKEISVPRRRLPDQFALRFWICPNYSYNGSVSALPVFRSHRQTLYFDNLTDRSENDTLYVNNEAPTVKIAGSKDIFRLAPYSWRFNKTTPNPISVSVRNAVGAVVKTERFFPLKDPPRDDTVRCLIDFANIDPGLISVTAETEETEIYYRPESHPDRAPMAAIDLYADSHVPEPYRFVDANGNPQFKKYTCRIDRQSSTWRYIIVPRFSTTLQANQLAIEDVDARFTFGVPTEIQTTSGEKAFAIESVDSIPHQEEPIKGLSLKKNTADLIEELPNPGPDQIQVLKSGIYSEIFVYV